MAEQAIKLPFALDAYGRIARTSDQEKIWADRVLSVIGTKFRERVMIPAYGSAISNYMYESTERAQEGINTAVERAFVDLLPSLTLLDVDITTDPELGQVLIDITYELPNDEETNTVVAIVAIGGKNPPVQENL
jgi:phage baseplate assembly protein W